MDLNLINTVKDFFNQDDPIVYHFVHSSRVVKNQALNLRISECVTRNYDRIRGIFTIWRDDPQILSSVYSSQLCGSASIGEKADDFFLATIHLKDHNITANDVMPDLNGGTDMEYSSNLVILKDILGIPYENISKFTVDNADILGITFKELKDYNIKHKPTDYDKSFLIKFSEEDGGLYRQIDWIEY